MPTDAEPQENELLEQPGESSPLAHVPIAPERKAPGSLGATLAVLALVPEFVLLSYATSPAGIAGMIACIAITAAAAFVAAVPWPASARSGTTPTPT